MSTITAAIVTHQRPKQLKFMVWMLENQTELFDEIKIYASGYDEDELSWVKYPISYQPDKKDWGHEKRAMAMNEAETDYVLCASDDDIYPYHFLEQMKKGVEDSQADIIACDFRTQREADGEPYHTAEPKLGGVTSGSMIIKTSFVKNICSYDHRDFGADGKFAQDAISKGGTFYRVPELLFFHY
jgi:hypothetical protein